jgi:hypothetical protein
MNHIILAVMPGVSQTSGQKPSFEVVSIKANTAGGTVMIGNQHGGRFVATNVTLIRLSLMAFRPMQASQIVGGPGWLLRDRFDIHARAEGVLAPLVEVLVIDSVKRPSEN